MSCVKCNDKFVLTNLASKVHFLSEFEELIQKSEIFAQKLGILYKELNGMITIFVDDTHYFFSSNLDAINSFFSLQEKENIKIFIEDESHPFSYQAILSSKPLQRYVALLEDREFFDIVNNESITSYFQPIVKMQDSTIFGYEMLARGVKPNGSLMYPDELFSKSKRNDFDFRLDRLCRESALKTAATKKVNQKVFINFIPTAIYDPEFCLNSTVKWANQLEFDPSNIVFEVVETEQVKNQTHLKNILEYYRDKGFQIALDDIGEGYSSLNLLIELRPDIIKVDRKIISNIDKDSLKQSVYKALYNLAKENGILVLAEGVETAFELEMVKSIGVDFAQGYYFAKPMPEPIRQL